MYFSAGDFTLFEKLILVLLYNCKKASLVYFSAGDFTLFEKLILVLLYN